MLKDLFLELKLIVGGLGYPLQLTDAQVLLLVPAWESTPFWSVLQQHKDLQLFIVKTKEFWPTLLIFNSAPGSVFAKALHENAGIHVEKERCEL